MTQLNGKDNEVSATQASKSVAKLVVEIANDPLTKKSPAMVAALAELLKSLFV